MMLDLGHFGDEIGDLDELVLGIAAGDDDMSIGGFMAQEVDHLPDELVATAHGGGVLMAMRHRELPAIGVQFHPESVLTPDGKQLLKNFLTDD